MSNLTLLERKPERKLCVLVVDADADSRELLSILFESYGFEVDVATCVHDSLQLMQQTCPDLLISELMLPNQDGYSLIDQVKAFAAEFHTSIPAIALTACAQESDRCRALAAGFCRYLTKPLDINQLMDTVAFVV